MPCIAGMGQERTALRSRVDVLTAELAAAREGSADLRLRLDHFTGPGGPQARVKQLEAALQLVSLAYQTTSSCARPSDTIFACSSEHACNVTWQCFLCALCRVARSVSTTSS
jgi:hypothetical protein